MSVITVREADRERDLGCTKDQEWLVAAIQGSDQTWISYSTIVA